MTFETVGYAFTSIVIEGVDLNFYNLIGDIQIIEHATYVVPIATINLEDAKGILRKELTIQDGTRITIHIGVSEKDARPQKFRVYNVVLTSDNDTDSYLINCVLDAPKYTSMSLRSAYRGSSNSILSELNDLDLNEFEYSGTSTDDDQIWLGLGVTSSTFVQNVVKHGWVDESSAMMLCVDADHKMLYRNLSKQIAAKGKEAINVNKHVDGELTVSESRFFSNAGFRNAWLGTGQYRFHSGVDGDHRYYDKVKVPDLGGWIPINSQVKTAIEFTRIDTCAFDCGNVHENYQKAEYQNLRLKSNYSQMGSLLIHGQKVSVDLLDPIELRVEDLNEGKTASPPTNGRWLVLAKSKIVRGGYNYAERLEIMRPYVNETGLTELVSY